MELWAKSDGETLYEHSVLTYEVGMKLIDMLPFNKEEREELKRVSSLALILHDIGKGAVGFQAALRNGANWKGLRHEILSAAYSSQIIPYSEAVFSIITHHRDITGTLIKKVIPDEQLDEETGIFRGMVDEFNENIDDIKRLVHKLMVYGGCSATVPESVPYSIGIDSFWLIGTWNSRYGQMRKVDISRRKLAVMLRGIVKASDHIASSHTQLIHQIDLKEYHISKYTLRHFQEECQKAHGNIMLTAPTGSGKTEALLLWAQSNQYENARLFYVLPFQASINAMYERLVDIFKEENVGILHSNAISFLYNTQADDDEYEAQDYAKKVNSLAHEIYFPIRICTPHQLLRFGLKGTGWEYLYLELSNSIIIYDEIHAFRPRVVGLTLATARLLKNMGATIAFASATFPQFLKTLIKDKLGNINEIIPEMGYDTDKQILGRKRHIVKVIKGTLLDNLDIIIKEIQAGRKMLIIVNHVKSAQMIYKILEEYHPMLLHSRFSRKDRRNKECELLSENKPSLVIATQVIEVSLDIDYEVMFTEPAPIDALVQRFGRINRKGRRDPECIYVMENQISRHNLYSQERARVTIELLNEVSNPIGEDDLIRITNTVYKDGYSDEELMEFNLGYENDEILEFDKNLIAGISRDWVEDVLNNSDGVCEVLPIQYYNDYRKLMEKGLWIAAMDYMVPVSYGMVRGLVEKTDGVLIVDASYNGNQGLLLDEKPSNFDED